MFTLNLVSLFTLFSQWDSIPDITKLEALEKLASTHPDLVMQAFKDLHEPKPTVTSEEHTIIAHCKANQKIEAIKAFREWTGASLKEAKDAIDFVMSGHGFGYVLYEHQTNACKLREMYVA